MIVTKSAFNKSLISVFLFFGHFTDVLGDDSIAIGNKVVNNNANSIVIGSGADRGHDGAITIGFGMASHDNNIFTVGNPSTVSWEPSSNSTTALGTSNYRFEDVFSNKLSVNAASGNAAKIDLFADTGASNNDRWSIEAAKNCQECWKPNSCPGD
ncbi:hypothetical protein [Aliikangiella coralliicola]|uniref:Trimeric autotransporter adhesin YadA-like head domain-containing protein n=1 Tax=Aliikangiella coralliicola TaxID=2592383 RepID=A0A545UJ34_9GAMM|nr:hypothetical protein [Aliikangiella coralliicola]TQV89484.1 hypothetical protein FLL46_00970 [Aliikangiella coralliicola]